MDAVPHGAASIRFLGPGAGGLDRTHRRRLNRLNDLGVFGTGSNDARGVLVLDSYSPLLFVYPDVFPVHAQTRTE